jgi:hypothetical protein
MAGAELGDGVDSVVWKGTGIDLGVGVIMGDVFVLY